MTTCDTTPTACDPSPYTLPTAPTATTTSPPHGLDTLPVTGAAEAAAIAPAGFALVVIGAALVYWARHRHQVTAPPRLAATVGVLWVYAVVVLAWTVTA